MKKHLAQLSQLNSPSTSLILNSTLPQNSTDDEETDFSDEEEEDIDEEEDDELETNSLSIDDT